MFGLSFQKEVNIIIFTVFITFDGRRKQFLVPAYFSLVCVAKTAAEQAKLQPPLSDGRRRGPDRRFDSRHAYFIEVISVIAEQCAQRYKLTSTVWGMVVSSPSAGTLVVLYQLHPLPSASSTL